MGLDYVVYAVTPLLDVSSLSKRRSTRVHILGPLVKIYSVLDSLGICSTSSIIRFNYYGYVPDTAFM